MITQHDLAKRPEGRITPKPITMNEIKRKTESHIDKGEPETPKKEFPVTIIATGQYATADKMAEVYSISKEAKRKPLKVVAPIIQIAPESIAEKQSEPAKAKPKRGKKAKRGRKPKVK